VVIEASNDLMNWTSLVTNMVMANPSYFSDPVSSSLSERFYRLRLLP
jgi:hypothetical protein